MITRFNFGTEQSPVPDGYILDFGEAYSADRGFGWVTDTDTRSTPLDVTPNARERNAIDDPLRDTLIHMQYPEDNPNRTAVRTSAAWLYDVEDGRYRVTVGVGDPVFDDSIHRLDVEDNNFIFEFVPGTDELFATGTRIIDVTDGQITIDALDGGVNTKINFIEIASVTDTLINFGADSSSISEDYIIDGGEAYSISNGYGWVTEDSIDNINAIPLNLSPNTRERDLLEGDLRDSLIHMQYPEDANNPTAVKIDAAWEYALPDGEYRVTATVGDAAFQDSTHTINLEGANLIDSFTPADDDFFATATRVIEVTDGRLTVDAIGGENTKLNSIRIAPVTEVKINFGPENITALPDDYYEDIGEAYSDITGYGWITQESVGNSNPTPIDITGNTRSRGFAEDAISDSLIHMQYPEDTSNPTANTTPAAWEYAIPNGEYQVRVGVGDISFADSIHQINIEGVETIAGFEPSSGELLTTGTAIVDVNDGRLTVDAIGGENTKLNFIEISSVDA